MSLPLESLLPFGFLAHHHLPWCPLGCAPQYQQSVNGNLSPKNRRRHTSHASIPPASAATRPSTLDELGEDDGVGVPGAAGALLLLSTGDGWPPCSPASAPLLLVSTSPGGGVRSAPWKLAFAASELLVAPAIVGVRAGLGLLPAHRGSQGWARLVAS